MKKFGLVILLAILPIFASQQVFAEGGLMDNVGISLYGGLGIPTNGDQSSTLKTTDLLNLGPQFGLGVSYYFTEQIGIEAMCNYGFNYFKDDYKGQKEPVLTNMAISLNGVYYFNEMVMEDLIRPFARAGIGLYNWAYRDDGVGGDVIKPVNEELKGTSFGFNVGAGVDCKLLDNMSVGLILDYNMYFPKDEDKFGSSFAEQGYLSPQIKISYYIPTK